LGDEDEGVEGEADPGAEDAGLSAEGEFVDGVAFGGPGFAEADVGEADRAPCEDGGEPGDGEEPFEDVGLFFQVRKVAEETDEASDEDGDQGAAPAVDVAEGRGGLTLVGSSGWLYGTRRPTSVRATM
jgi:hypothetical protein